MLQIKSHKDLKVYQLALDYVEDVYSITNSFPSEERFGLTNQLRRASVSLPSNIAEGAARQSTKEFIQFLYIALGSLTEIETQLEISRRLNYIQDIAILGQKNLHLKRMLIKLIESLKGK